VSERDDRRDEQEVVAMTQHVVVVGAGVAGLEAALALNALARDEVSVELVAPEREFTYRALAVGEPFRVAEVKRFPLEQLVRAAGAELRTGAAVAVDPEEKTVRLADGGWLDYDVLVLAPGARAREAVPGTLTFRGPESVEAFETLIDRVITREVRRLVFALPAGASWPMPLYELALLTAELLVDGMTRGVEIVLVTPEERPLALFGTAASDAIADLLEIREVRVETGSAALRFADGRLVLGDGSEIEADAVVSLPRLEGVPIEGIPHDADGFVATDEFGWVLGLTDVYAAGDVIQSTIKQGGLATQQADAVAAAIAADAGAHVRPATYRPVLRGLLLTGVWPRYLRSDGPGRPSLVDTQPLWWPPAKIVGRHLAPFLADHLGLASETPRPRIAGAVSVEVALARDRAGWSPV
jgi:sulfide:quinone oxidoreductase